MEFPARVWRKGSSLVVTIPKNIAEYYDIREGDILLLEIKKLTRHGGEA